MRKCQNSNKQQIQDDYTQNPYTETLRTSGNFGGFLLQELLSTTPNQACPQKNIRNQEAKGQQVYLFDQNVSQYRSTFQGSFHELYKNIVKLGNKTLNKCLIECRQNYENLIEIIFHNQNCSHLRQYNYQMHKNSTQMKNNMLLLIKKQAQQKQQLKNKLAQLKLSFINQIRNSDNKIEKLQNQLEIKQNNMKEMANILDELMQTCEQLKKQKKQLNLQYQYQNSQFKNENMPINSFSKDNHDLAETSKSGDFLKDSGNIKKLKKTAGSLEQTHYFLDQDISRALYMQALIIQQQILQVQ